MKMVPLGDLMPSRIPSVNPAKHPEEMFELWSIPAFESGAPERLLGSEIGSSKKCVKPNDVLLSRIVPHIRRAWVVGQDNGARQIASGEWITFRSERFNPDYLRHYLMSDEFHVKFMQTVAGVGGSLLRARPDGVKAIEAPLPQLEEQKRIAGILDQADALRRLRQSSIDRLNTLGQAIFYEMFGEQIVEGENVDLRDIVEEFRYGTSNKAGEDGYPALRIPNIIGGEVDLSDLKTVPVTDKEFQRLQLIDGDLLFVRTNGNPNYVGRCAVFSKTDLAVENNFIYASYLIRARIREGSDPDFLQTYLSLPEGRKVIRENSKTSAGQFNINIRGLGSVPVPKVSPSKQKEFAARKMRIRGELWRMQKALAESDGLFRSLQQSAFRGEL